MAAHRTNVQGHPAATLLVKGDKLGTVSAAAGLVISMPATPPDKISSTIALKIGGALSLNQT